MIQKHTRSSLLLLSSTADILQLYLFLHHLLYILYIYCLFSSSIMTMYKMNVVFVTGDIVILISKVSINACTNVFNYNYNNYNDILCLLLLVFNSKNTFELSY